MAHILADRPFDFDRFLSGAVQILECPAYQAALRRDGVCGRTIVDVVMRAYYCRIASPLKEAEQVENHIVEFIFSEEFCQSCPMKLMTSRSSSFFCLG